MRDRWALCADVTLLGWTAIDPCAECAAGQDAVAGSTSGAIAPMSSICRPCAARYGRRVRTIAQSGIGHCRLVRVLPDSSLLRPRIPIVRRPAVPPHRSASTSNADAPRARASTSGGGMPGMGSGGTTFASRSVVTAAVSSSTCAVAKYKTANAARRHRSDGFA